MTIPPAVTGPDGADHVSAREPQGETASATTVHRAARALRQTVRMPAARTASPNGVARPDLETFRALARDRRVIPVTRRLLADGETPVAVYRKLAGERPGTFLLESAEHGRVWSRYSFVGRALARRR